MSESYDCIVVGAGPAGLGAGLYTSRDRLKTLILEKFLPGGQITLHLTKYADGVTLIHRRDEFRATKVVVEELLKKVDE